MDESRLRQDIVETGKRLYNKGFVASNDGNISIRLSEREILITPTGVSKGYMSTSDMLKVDIEGNVISGFLKPTSEMKMHLAVYKKRPDVRAIVHAHPPKATAFAVAGIKFDRITLPEVVFSLGYISMTEYGTPTTHEVPRSIEKHIGNSDAVLLANHGALTVGKDVFDAYYKMETLEHFSSISLYARLLGGEKALDENQTQELFRIRQEVYGKSNPNCTGCGACANGDCNTGVKTANQPDYLPTEPVNLNIGNKAQSAYLPTESVNLNIGTRTQSAYLPTEPVNQVNQFNQNTGSKTHSNEELRESIKRIVLAELLKMQE